MTSWNTDLMDGLVQIERFGRLRLLAARGAAVDSR